MKYFISTFCLFFLFFSFSTQAKRNWVGGTSVHSIKNEKADSTCGPNGGACLVIFFKDDFQGCKGVSIRESDPHFKHIQSMAYISLTSGKKLKLYVSDEHCYDADQIGVNDVLIY